MLTYVTYLFPFQTANHFQISGVRNSSMHNQNPIIHYSSQGQPSVHAFEELQNSFVVLLETYHLLGRKLEKCVLVNYALIKKLWNL